jgi:hypothetical protein
MKLARRSDLCIANLVEEAFAHLPRVDQRRWAYAYLNGLMLGGTGKKTVQQLARSMPPGVNPSHGLQQFINSSPWEWAPVREALAAIVGRALPLEAWTAEVVSIPKRGEHSVGVHRRFLPWAGRTVNCQVAVGLFHSSAASSTPIDWRLVLDDLWTGNEVRRRRARIPETASAQPLCMEVLALVDAVCARGAFTAPLVVDLRIAKDIGHLADELVARGVTFVIEVSPAQPVLPILRRPTKGVLARSGQTSTASEVCLRDGSRTRLQDHGFASSALLSVRPVGLPGSGSQDAASERVYRLIARRPTGAGEQPRFWITSIVNRTASEIIALAGHVSHARGAVRELQENFGAFDFEGRSYPGWHHHMTMVSAAHVLRTLQAPDSAVGTAAEPLPPPAGLSWPVARQDAV